MRIYLQTQPDDSGAIRYAHLVLQEDLLEGWTLMKESRRQGMKGKITREHFQRHQEALDSMIETRDKLISRGYHVVFLQGEGRRQ